MLSEGTPILRIQNLNKGKNWFYSNLNLPPDKYCNEGDLLYAWSATFGPYWWHGPKAIFHYHIWNVFPSELMSKEFAFYELMRITDAIKRAAHGVAMPHITKGGMEAWEIMLPPPAEQRRIADKVAAVLGRVDACRARLDRIPALLKRFRQSVLAAATSGELTADWREENANPEWNSVSLGEVADDFSYGTSAKSSPSGDTPVLRMGNIQDGRLDWADLVYTSDKNEIEKYRLRPGDVLFNRTNSPELVGKTAVYTGERSAIYAGYIIRVRCSEDLLPHYLNYCLNGPSGRDYCWQVKTDGVSQSNINAKKLAAFRFDLPSLSEQAEIVSRVDSLFALADRIEARLATAQRLVERLTPATLAKAFRGELVPQDPEDEPASVLLERLRSNVRDPSPKARSRKKG
jgi:type I restriction enzyme S subunit